jgi:hypothetical protein
MDAHGLSHFEIQRTPSESVVKPPVGTAGRELSAHRDFDCVGPVDHDRVRLL